MGQTEVVCAKDVIKIHANRILLNKLNMSISEGEYYSVYAAPKAGKSVLINCILSLLPIEKGEISLFGQKMSENALELKKRIGVVLDKPAVFRELTVRENIAFFADMYLNKKEISRDIEWALGWMQLNNCRNLYPSRLSTGELRRLDLACGAVHEPDLLVMDEPVGKMDEVSQKIIYEGLNELHAEGKTILTTSSDEEYIAGEAHTIAFLDHGRIIAQGSQESLKGMISLKESLVIRTSSFSLEQEKMLRSLLGVEELEYVNGELIIRDRKGRNQVKKVMEFFRQEGIGFEVVYIKKPSIADVFFEITGHRPDK